MRFAWQRKNSTDNVSARQSATGRIIYITYNVVYWFPIVFAFTGIITYWMGFITFFLILLARAAANLYRNNVPPAEEGEFFALRSP